MRKPGVFSRLLIVSALLLGGVSLAAAHSNEHLATMQGAHGGMIRAADHYHLELLVEDGQVRVWVTDHGDTPQATTGAEGRVMVASGKRRLSVKLAPAGDNVLRGEHPELIDSEHLRAAVTVTMQGEGPVQARFSKAAK